MYVPIIQYIVNIIKMINVVVLPLVNNIMSTRWEFKVLTRYYAVLV